MGGLGLLLRLADAAQALGNRQTIRSCLPPPLDETRRRAPEVKLISAICSIALTVDTIGRT